MCPDTVGKAVYEVVSVLDILTSALPTWLYHGLWDSTLLLKSQDYQISNVKRLVALLGDAKHSYVIENCAVLTVHYAKLTPPDSERTYAYFPRQLSEIIAPRIGRR